MSTLDEICGSAMRAAAIRLVVREASEKGEPLNLANIGLACNQFGPTFGDLGEDELNAAIAELQVLEPTPEDEGEAEAAAFSRYREGQRAPLVAPDAEPTMSADEVAEVLHSVEHELVTARQAVLEAQQTQRATRGTLSQTVLSWQNGGQVMTREQLQRDYIASEQARKLAGHPHGRRPTAGPSAIDRLAVYSGQGNGNRMQVGSHHRATPLVPGGQLYPVGKRRVTWPVATKLPSNR
jgi:hypothetical protein